MGVVEENIEFMLRPGNVDDGTMIGCIIGESIGGNAGMFRGSTKRYYCAGVACQYDEDGRLLYFGCQQNPDPEVACRLIGGDMWRVAIDGVFSHDLRFRIVESSIQQDTANPLERIILQTISVYNSLHGFVPE